jgi:hypothetical protein
MTLAIIANWREKLNILAEPQKKQHVIAGDTTLQTIRNK